MAEASIKPCSECGANVYPDHINAGKAGYDEGKLLCSVCYEEHMEALSEPEDDEPIALVTTSSSSQPSETVSKYKRTDMSGAIGAVLDASADESMLKRELRDTGKGATRCRTFHAKLNEKALAYMNEHINEWVDEHPDVDIKFASSTVGIFEGKHPEPNLIVTIFY